MNNSENFEVHTMNDLKGLESTNSNDNLKSFSPLLKNTPGITTLSTSTTGSSGNSVKTFMIVLFIFLLVGAGVLAYLDYTEKITFLNFLKKAEIVESTPEIEQPIINEDKEEEKISKSLYSDELSNYLLIDTENENILSNIQSELDIIRTNLPEQKFSQPISFIVTNKNSQPISFSDFSVHANMNVPTDILLALNDKFEIYAYDDFETGVRFGLQIEIKNEVALNKALETNYQTLPNNLSVFFKNFTIDSTKNKTFTDSDYKTYKIKYLNLDEAKTYSIDYTINKNSWIIGTSKKTFRAILDKLDKGNSTETNLNLKQNNDSGETTSENTPTKN